MERLQPIKVGRIARAIERALGLSLTGEVAIYMRDKDLNALAAKRPTSYLRQIEEIGAILKNPDFVCFASETEEFSFVKGYIREGQLSLVFVRVKRWQTRWYVEGIETGLKALMPLTYRKAKFVRPQYKKLPEAE